MNKCVSCGSELPPQTRFCGTCGTVQPDKPKTDGPKSIETIRSVPHGENAPANTPPPPPQFPQFGQEENKPHINSSTGQSGNPPSGPPPQPETVYGEYQQPYSNYQPAMPPQSPYGNYQEAQPPYNYQPTPPYNYQATPQLYNYQPNPPSQPPYGNYQPTPQPQPSLSGIHISETVANPQQIGIIGAPPVTAGPQPKAPSWLKWVIIGVVAVVILAGSGILAYNIFLKPTPTIAVTSDYHDNGILAGSGGTTDGTTFHLTGKQFSANSAITFLLDSTVINTQIASDPSGNVSTDLKVTSSWSIGQHKLTAHDANNNTTNTGVPISIVQQGEAHTPGPNGAPSNDATFTINVNAQGQWDDNSRFNWDLVLKVTGQHNPQVCTDLDNDQPQPGTITFNGTTYRDQSTYTCTGTYKGGTIKYTQTLQAMNIFDSSGNTCSLSSPVQSYRQINGNYADQQFKGETIQNSIDATLFTCSLPFNLLGAKGTWTGPVSNI